MQSRCFDCRDEGCSLMASGLQRVDQLHQRGMLENTLVCNLAEFGRTPRSIPARRRDHWPQCWTVYFAGGGVRASGREVTDRRLRSNVLSNRRRLWPIIAASGSISGLMPGTTASVPLADYGTQPIMELFERARADRFPPRERSAPTVRSAARSALTPNLTMPQAFGCAVPALVFLCHDATIITPATLSKPERGRPRPQRSGHHQRRKSFWRTQTSRTCCGRGRPPAANWRKPSLYYYRSALCRFARSCGRDGHSQPPRLSGWRLWGKAVRRAQFKSVVDLLPVG